jgi:gamma-glutamyl-gamma-aminobutyrate hydrolase PuuD
LNTTGFKRYHLVEISDNRRPVYGILTEPIRGNMKTQEEEDGNYINQTDGISYIPKAHVQFLEQAGIRVVPISYTDSKENITSILDQVNGVYMPGDSHKSIMNPIYHKAFTSILDYVIDHNKNKNDYFPMFMMGKSSQIFV